LVYFSVFGMFGPKKIWQPCFRRELFSQVAKHFCPNELFWFNNFCYICANMFNLWRGAVAPQ
jgi:hypothetical protein